MEAVHVHLSSDQSVSPCKQIRTPRKNYRPSFSRSCKNFGPSIKFEPGILKAPPSSLAYSVPPSISILRRPPQPHNQPPLLPLPISKPYNTTTTTKISNRIRTRDQSRTPKKSKPSTSTVTSPRKEDYSKHVNTKSAAKTSASSECLIISSTNRLGPDPRDLPKDFDVVSRAYSLSSSTWSSLLSSSNNSDSSRSDGVINSRNSPISATVDDLFSGSSVFTLSPPPSSLPLPTFSLRPKLSCKAEAAGGIDAGATDNLCRLLRLR